MFNIHRIQWTGLRKKEPASPHCTTSMYGTEFVVAVRIVAVSIWDDYMLMCVAWP